MVYSCLPKIVSKIQIQFDHFHYCSSPLLNRPLTVANWPGCPDDHRAQKCKFIFRIFLNLLFPLLHLVFLPVPGVGLHFRTASRCVKRAYLFHPHLTLKIQLRSSQIVSNHPTIHLHITQFIASLFDNSFQL